MKLRLAIDKFLVLGIILLIMSIGVIIVISLSQFNMYKENAELVSQSKQVIILSERIHANAELKFAILKNKLYTEAESSNLESNKLDSVINLDLVALEQMPGKLPLLSKVIDSLRYSIQQFSTTNNTVFQLIQSGDKEKASIFLNKGSLIENLVKIETYVIQLQQTEEQLAVKHRGLHDKNTSENSITLAITVLATIFLIIVLLLRASFNHKFKKEKDLIESENKYRLLVEDSPDAIVIYQKGKIAFVNAETVQLMKATSKDELIGKPVLEFIHPDQRGFVIDRMKKLVKEAVPLPVAEEKFLRLDGSLIDVEVKSIPIQFNGEIAAQAIIRDISKRKKAENLLKASEEKYKSIIAASPDGVVITDLEGRCLMASPVAQKIYGATEQEIIGRLVTDFIISEDRERAQSNLALMFQGNMSGPGEYIGIHQTGSYFNMEANAEFIRDAEGNPQQLVFIIRDISDRKKEEAEIINRKEALKEAQRIGKIGSWELNHQTGQLIWSEQVYHIVQRDSQTFQPSFEAFLEMLVPEEVEMVKTTFETSVKNHTKYDIVHKVIMPNNEIKYLHELGETIYDKAGNPLISIGTGQDITEIKKAEQKLEKSNRLFLFISMINQMIVRTTSELMLFEEACKIAVTVGHFKMAWIGKIDQVTNLVVPLIHAGDERGYTELLNKISLVKEKPESKGPTARAILEGKHVVCNDIENDASMKIWRDEALIRGYHSSISLPILKFGKVTGAFSIYAGVKGFFDETEISLLEEATSDISFAIEIFEKEKERHRALEKLKEQKAQLETLSDNLPGVMIYQLLRLPNGEKRFTYVSNGVAQITGKTSEEVIANPNILYEIIHKEDLPDFLAKEALAEKNNTVFNAEVRCVDAVGNIHWLQITSTPRILEDGMVVWDGFYLDITSQKMALEKIRLANDRFELIATATNDIVWDWDFVTNKLWWNQNYFDVFGFEKSNAPLDIESWRKHIHPEDQKRVRERINKILAAGDTFWDDEFRCLKSNGELLYIYDRGFIQYDKDGKPIRMTGSMLDFTERKKTEDARRRTEEKYRTLVEQASDAILIANEKGEFITVNTSATKISGYTEQELMKLSFFDFTVPEDIAANPFKFEALNAGKTLVVERLMQGKGGKRLHVEITSKLLSDGRLLIFVRDISERIKVQNEIIKEKNLSDSIINSLPGVFYLVTEKGKFLRWNKNFEEVTQYTAAEIMMLSPMEFFEEANKIQMAKEIKEAFDTNKFSILTEFYLKNQQKVPYYLSGIILEYEGEKCMMGVGIDFTERVKAQEEIKGTTEKLRALTAHVLNIREEERKRIGREIHDDLGQQLTAIKMDIAWLAKKMPPENAMLHTKISNIHSLLDGSNKAVRRILNELRPGILDDYGLLGALEMLNSQFKNSTGIPVEFVTNVAELKLPVPTATCIFRVFQEAFTNITKYADAKSVTSSLTVLDGFILINIDDDGKGFDPATVKSKKSFGLLGMKERVFSLGGSFEVNSYPFKGTRIIISLPLVPLQTLNL